MNRYQVEAKLGQGTYGDVLQARRCCDGGLVAIKALKKKSDAALVTLDDAMRLREVQALQQLGGQHPNIVRLIEVIRERGGRIYLIMEFAPHGDLYGWIKRRQLEAAAGSSALPSAAVVRRIMRPLLSALAHLHARAFIHRDIKPENVLLADGGGLGGGGGGGGGFAGEEDAVFPYTVKLGDFGLARRGATTAGRREEGAQPPFTQYVSTRWYRSPELLLKAPAQTSAVDIWAAGCVMAELFSLQPLLPGESQLDQIGKTVKLLGAPTQATWPDGVKLASRLKLRLPQALPPGCPPPILRALPPHAGADASVLLCLMLAFDPVRRISAERALQTPFVAAGGQQQQLVSPPPSLGAQEEGMEAEENEEEEEEGVESEDEEEEEEDAEAHDLSVLMGEELDSEEEEGGGARQGLDVSVLMGQNKESDEDEEEQDVLALLEPARTAPFFSMPAAAAAAAATAAAGGDDVGSWESDEEEEEDEGVFGEEGHSEQRLLSPPTTGESSPAAAIAAAAGCSDDESPSPSPSPDDEEEEEPSPPPPFSLSALRSRQQWQRHGNGGDSSGGDGGGGIALGRSFSPPWQPASAAAARLPFPMSQQPRAALSRLPPPPPPPPQLQQPISPAPSSAAWTTPAALLYGSSAEGGGPSLGDSTRSALTTSSSNSSGSGSGSGSSDGGKSKGKGKGRGRGGHKKKTKGSFLGRIKGLDDLKHPLFFSPSPPQREKQAGPRGSPGWWGGDAGEKRT